MTTPVAQLARELLDRDGTALVDLEIYQFARDADDAHDDGFQDRLAKQFAASFENAQAELVKALGQPSNTGDQNNPCIPLCGVFRFAVWVQDNKSLFLAAAHEDRECPYLLMLGTGAGEVAAGKMVT